MHGFQDSVLQVTFTCRAADWADSAGSLERGPVDGEDELSVTSSVNELAPGGIAHGDPRLPFDKNAN